MATKKDIIENWNHPIDPHESTNLHSLIEVIASENERIDVELDDLYDERFLDTATGHELEKIGQLIGIKRKEGESNEKLRTRIKAGFSAAASDTTYESFASASLSILDTNPSAINIKTPPQSGSKVVEIEIDGKVINDNILNESEVSLLLNKSLSIDARVDVVITGTFGFDGSNPNLKGWNEGTWSSTI